MNMKKMYQMGARGIHGYGKVSRKEEKKGLYVHEMSARKHVSKRQVKKRHKDSCF